MRKGSAQIAVLLAFTACADKNAGPGEAARAEAARQNAASAAAPPATGPELPRDAKARLDQLARDDLDAELTFRPSVASWLGAHGWDDRLEDVRLDAQLREVGRLRLLLERLSQLDVAALDATRATDLALLERRVQAELFELTDSRPLERNPLVYVDVASSAVEELMDDAPAVDRVRALAARLWRIRPLLDEARRNLRGPAARLAIEKAIDLAQAAKGFVGETLPRAVQTADPKLADDFRAACGDASRALDDFAGWLARDLSLRARGELAALVLGRERFLERLRLVDGVTATPEQLVALGEREIKEARRRLDDAGRAIVAGRPGVEAARLVEDDHAKPEELLPQAQAAVESAVQFVRDHKLVTLPDPERPKVLEMPPARWGFVQLALAGPLDPKPRDAVLYVDPVDKTWPERRKQEHLRTLNRAALLMAVLHDVVGRYVLAERDRRAPTTTLKIALAPAFVEGWAGYVERMMLDEGFAAGDAKVRFAVERAALLRAGRLVAAVRLHALGAKLDDVIKVFLDEAGCDADQARREAERAAIDPWVALDALGRIEIEKLRDDWRAAHPSATLGEFHDALLAHGTPPVAVLRKLLLPGDNHSPL
jgi:uncharacterized protein (DUF885 family)